MGTERVYLRRFFFTAVCLMAAVILASCGSETGGSTGQGSVALLLTDNSTDGIAEINIRITRVELLGGDGKVTIFRGDKTVDLLKLAGEANLFSVSSGVTEGFYEKIRLHVQSIEIVKNDDTRFYPKLPKNGRLDLNPRGKFFVTHGETLVIQVDLDAEKSIHFVQAGNSGRYIFRPVVFIKVIDGVRVKRGKLVRVSGVVRKIDLDNRVFKLCPEDTVYHAVHSLGEDNDYSHDYHDRSRCVPVIVSVEASLFNDNGDRFRFVNLMENESVTVVGHIRLDNNLASYQYDRLDGVCEDDSCTVGIDAAVVEVGTFLTLSGTARSSVDESTGKFDYEVDRAQGFVSGTMLKVLVQEGTKVFSRLGTPLTAGDIRDGIGASIDGVMSLSPEPVLLKSALIILDRDTPVHTMIEGDISSIDPEGRTFELIRAGMTETTCVYVPEGAFVFFINIEDTHLDSTEKTFGDLFDGQHVELYGDFAGPSGCFKAVVVLIAQPVT